MNRREYLAAGGIALTTPIVGCLGTDADPELDTTTGEPNDGATNRRTVTPTEHSGSDEHSIHGRLSTDTDEPKRFTVMVKDPDETVLGDWKLVVGPTGFRSIPAVGQPGSTRSFEVTVGDTTVSETLTFDVDRTPRRVDGYVDIGFTAGGDLTIDFTPLEYPHETPVVPDARIDAPPYEIERPDRPDDPSEDNWNEAYLGEHMEKSPSIEFAVVTPSSSVLPPPERGFDGNVYWVDLVTSEGSLDARLSLDSFGEATRTHLRNADFDESVLVAVETGFGSGSVEHRWARVEPTESGISLHGYYTDPYVQTDDLTTRVSLIEVVRPAAAVDVAHVSLTVGEDRRVHFNSTEGPVTADSPDSRLGRL